QTAICGWPGHSLLAGQLRLWRGVRPSQRPVPTADERVAIAQWDQRLLAIRTTITSSLTRLVPPQPAIGSLNWLRGSYHRPRFCAPVTGASGRGAYRGPERTRRHLVWAYRGQLTQAPPTRLARRHRSCRRGARPGYRRRGSW